MTKREVVIREFERFMQEYSRDIGYTNYDEEVLKGVLALLKAQHDNTLIKCKDCDNWERDWTPTGLHPNKVEIHYCPYVDKYPSAEWFCADAERRHDG